MYVLMHKDDKEWEYDYCLPSELAEGLSEIEQVALPMFCDRKDAVAFMSIQQERWPHLIFKIQEVNLEKINE